LMSISATVLASSRTLPVRIARRRRGECKARKGR
jgi:hypothetical protein